MHLSKHTNKTTPIHICLHTSQTYPLTFQIQNMQIVVYSRCWWFRSQVLYMYWYGSCDQHTTNKTHNNKRHHLYALMWTHLEMGLSTSRYRYFHAKICRQDIIIIGSSINTQHNMCHTVKYCRNYTANIIVKYILKQWIFTNWYYYIGV